jgi:hypothetical protein
MFLGETNEQTCETVSVKVNHGVAMWVRQRALCPAKMRIDATVVTVD